MIGWWDGDVAVVLPPAGRERKQLKVGDQDTCWTKWNGGEATGLDLGFLGGAWVFDE